MRAFHTTRGRAKGQPSSHQQSDLLFPSEKTKAGQCPQPNFVVNFVVNFVDKVDDNVDDEDAQFLFFITVRDG